MTEKQIFLKVCPFCGEKPAGIVFQTHKNGRPAGHVLKIEHKDLCFIANMSTAYYGKPEYCAKEWNGRFGND